MKKIIKKPILIFSLAYVPFVGGAELAVKEITDRLPDETFHLITYRFDRAWQKREVIGNVEVFRVGWGRRGGSYYGRRFEKFLFMPLAFFKGWRLHRAHRYGIFWSLMASRASAPAFFLKLLYPKTQFFLTIQEGDTPAYAHKRAGVFRVIWRRVFRAADRIQAISTYLKQWCVDEGADPSAVDVVPNGVDISRFSSVSQSETDAVRSKLGIVSDEKIIITTSRLVRKNGIDVLLAALRKLSEEQSPRRVRALIIGTGPEEMPLRAYAKSYGLSVDFLGDIPNNAVPTYLSCADVFVRPSRSEGLGISFLEAMAAGIPIIGTAVGGIPDFLEDRVTGLVIGQEHPSDCAEKIRELFSNSDLRATLIRNGQAIVKERYDWNLIARRFEGIFYDLFRRSELRHVLLASGIFPPDIGGSATYSDIVYHRLSAVCPAKVTAVVYADGSFRGGRDVVRVPRRILYGIRHAAFCAACLWYGRTADVFLSADASLGSGAMSWLAARLVRKPYCVRITGEYAWEQGVLRFGVTDSLDAFQKKRYRLPVEAMRYVEHTVVRNADRVIAPSEYLKHIAEGWGVDPSNVTVIYNAYIRGENASGERGLSKKDARAALGLPPRAPCILSIGRLVPWKGFSELIAAMPDLVRAVPSAELVIIGDGPEERRLKNQCAHDGIGDHVRFVGRVGADMLARYIRAADVFVLNSRYEGFSHQLLEVLERGTPAIATDVGGNCEIIQNGVNGMIVPVGNRDALLAALKKIIEDVSYARLLGRNASASVRQFSVSRMLDALCNLLSTC